MSEHNGQALVDLILARRSIRGGFTSQEVAEEIIDQIVECGIRAPSSKNAQPWMLHVVTDTELLTAVADRIRRSKHAEVFVPHSPKTGEPRPEYRSSVIESADILEAAPLGIFIENQGLFTDSRAETERALRAGGPSTLIALSLEFVGFGAAMENMLLAAQAFGVRGVFMGDALIAEEFIKVALGMEGDLVGVISLGYSEADPDPKVVNRDNMVWHRP